ncbi:MAG: bacterial regulatory, arsR family protein [Microbacteriaceae bacterium]|nr:bacterial regulatory, arsR family protein [Microbacteriaceae bacterium]
MNSNQLDATFAALADPTRRAILARLGQGDATVSQLAEPFAMSMPAVSRHLKVLEKAGLISRNRYAQSRPSHLEARPLKGATDWMSDYEQFWNVSFDALDEHLSTVMKERER